MISLNFENLVSVTKKHGLSLAEIKKDSEKIPKLLEQIKKRNQGFYEILDDRETVKKIATFAKKIKGKYKSIVVLGIGGSALGTICLQQSLKHCFENELKNSKTRENTPKLYVLDNIDPQLISEIEDIIDYGKTLFIVVTKSGTTPETLSQYFYFRDKIRTKSSHKLNAHFVFITDRQKGRLRQIANEEKITTFEIPENVGGRFSVLTTVGLLPAALIGINIGKLIEGAKTMCKKFFSKNFTENLPYQIATIQYLLNKKGKTINVLMPYSQKLIRFADWYRQLLAESIGKKLNNKGKEIFAGITPINALGVTDQHSQLQLYSEGPNDKLIIFIEVGAYANKKFAKLEIPSAFMGKKITFHHLLQTEKNATVQALTQTNRPNITLKINQIDENTLGELFLLFEASIAFLGELFDINAYDQPGVELSKTLTKKYLAQN
ncbi:glucose-6-phosphate isomerase [Candidatus Peregrinibacteria bacterium]|nr:glucose-6-phosphate isomerase [Candidatus Peregrinibacteria bacterium]